METVCDFINAVKTVKNDDFQKSISDECENRIVSSIQSSIILTDDTSNLFNSANFKMIDAVEGYDDDNYIDDDIELIKNNLRIPFIESNESNESDGLNKLNSIVNPLKEKHTEYIKEYNKFKDDFQSSLVYFRLVDNNNLNSIKHNLNSEYDCINNIKFDDDLKNYLNSSIENLKECKEVFYKKIKNGNNNFLDLIEDIVKTSNKFTYNIEDYTKFNINEIVKSSFKNEWVYGWDDGIEIISNICTKLNISIDKHEYSIHLIDQSQTPNVDERPWDDKKIREFSYITSDDSAEELYSKGYKFELDNSSSKAPSLIENYIEPIQSAYIKLNEGNDTKYRYNSVCNIKACELSYLYLNNATTYFTTRNGNDYYSLNKALVPLLTYPADEQAVIKNNSLITDSDEQNKRWDAYNKSKMYQYYKTERNSYKFYNGNFKEYLFLSGSVDNDEIDHEEFSKRNILFESDVTESYDFKKTKIQKIKTVYSDNIGILENKTDPYFSFSGYFTDSTSWYSGCPDEYIQSEITRYSNGKSTFEDYINTKQYIVETSNEIKTNIIENTNKLKLYVSLFKKDQVFKNKELEKAYKINSLSTFYDENKTNFLDYFRSYSEFLNYTINTYRNINIINDNYTIPKIEKLSFDNIDSSFDNIYDTISEEDFYKSNNSVFNDLKTSLIDLSSEYKYISSSYIDSIKNGIINLYYLNVNQFTNFELIGYDNAEELKNDKLYNLYKDAADLIIKYNYLNKMINLYNDHLKITYLINVEYLLDTNMKTIIENYNSNMLNLIKDGKLLSNIKYNKQIIEEAIKEEEKVIKEVVKVVKTEVETKVIENKNIQCDVKLTKKSIKNLKKIFRRSYNRNTRSNNKKSRTREKI